MKKYISAIFFRGYRNIGKVIIVLILFILGITTMFVPEYSNSNSVDGFPEDKVVDVEKIEDVLHNNDEFSKYVNEIEFTGRSEYWGKSQGFTRTGYFLDINVESNNSFKGLSNENKFHVMKSMIEEIEENDDYTYTGSHDVYKFGEITLMVDEGKDTYSMHFLDEWEEHQYGLEINDDETYRPEREQKKYEKVNAKIEKEEQEKEIYDYMEFLYKEITNNGQNYVPEVHDSEIDELTSEKFDISESEANRIYLKYKTK